MSDKSSETYCPVYPHSLLNTVSALHRTREEPECRGRLLVSCVSVDGTYLPSAHLEGRDSRWEAGVTLTLCFTRSTGTYPHEARFVDCIVLVTDDFCGGYNYASTV